jgi:hypothetical protein
MSETKDSSNEWEQRYQQLLLSSYRTLREKELELSKVVTAVVIAATVLFVAWLYHEDAWQEKLDRALSDCLVAMSDGTCAKRDATVYR